MTSLPIPQPFEPTRKRLWDELVNIHDAWDQYQILFGHSPEHVEMLNACAGWFFSLVQRLLLREVLLGISRLTDPLKSGRNTNLVLESLLQDPAVIADPASSAKISAAIAQAKIHAKPMRVHRHKYIAHLDHAVALGAPGILPKGVTGQTITVALASIEEPYLLHSVLIRESHPSFEVSTTRGSKALLRILRDSDRWKTFQAIKQEKLSP